MNDKTKDEASYRAIEHAIHARLNTTTERERDGETDLSLREPRAGDRVVVTIAATGLRYRLTIARAIEENAVVAAVIVDAWGTERTIPRAALRHPHPKASMWECSDATLIPAPTVGAETDALNRMRNHACDGLAMMALALSTMMGGDHA